MLADLVASANIGGHDLWDHVAVKERTEDGRPFLSIDRLSQPIYSLVNQQREAGAALTVHPVDARADPETAEILQGVIRNIETQSRATLAYTWGFEGAVRMGRGYLRVLPEYVSDRSMDQDLRIKRVMNPFSVYRDPGAQEPDYSDAMYYFVSQDFDLDDYNEIHGEIDAVESLEEFRGLGDQVPFWCPNGHIRVVEYYWVDIRRDTLHIFRDPQGSPLPVFASELKEFQQFAAARRIAVGDPAASRPVEIRQIHWTKMNGRTTLHAGTDVPGRWIPIIPVLGEELFVDGMYDLRGIVRGAVEAAKVYNFQVTALIEAVNLLPKSPFIIAAGQVKGFEHFWRDANLKNYAYLPYGVMDVNGHLVPPPQRNPAMPALQPLVAAIVQADNDIKAATRYFDASLGREGPESSGRAILARQRQGNTGTAHFESNFREITLTHLGRILVDQIPTYYDAPRMARIVGVDNQPKAVMLNTPFIDAEGVERVYQLGVGQYDVTVTAGSGYPTKQQETRELLTEVVRAVPQTFPLIGDLYMKALGLHDIAKRLEQSLPPGLRGDEGDKGPPIPPDVQQQMDRLMQEHDALKAEYAEAKRALETQAAKVQAETARAEMDTASKERIAQAQLAQKAQEAMGRLELEVERLRAQTATQRQATEARQQELVLESQLAGFRQEQAERHEILLQLLKERGEKEVERHPPALHDEAATAARDQLPVTREGDGNA